MASSRRQRTAGLCLGVWLWWTAAAVALPLQDHLPPTDLAGRPVSTEQLRGRITVLVLAGQANEAEATAVSDEIVAAMNAQPERYAFVVVMDLAGVPEFGRGLSVAIVRERLEREDQLLAARLEQGGQIFKPPLRLQLPDWSGQTTRFWLAAIPEAGYAVFRAPEGHTRFERDRLQRERQRLRSEVQVFVLDEKHELRAQYVGRSAGARAIEAMRTLQPHSPAALGNLQ